jgi:hypothetical protein
MRRSSPAHSPAATLAEGLASDGAGVVAHQELHERSDLVHCGKFLDARRLEHDLRSHILLAHFVQLGLLLDLRAHEWRVDEAWADAVDRDAIGGGLKGHDLGQAENSVLGSNVAAV